MLRYVNYRMRITLQDARVLVGTFMAFDRHMNIVLGDTEEFRKIRTKKSGSGSGLTEEREERRALGLIILRGDAVVSMTIEGPPPPDMDEKIMPGGPGVVKNAAARGVPITGMGLAGPVAGIGGPGMGIMQPASQVAAHMAPRPGMIPPPPGGMGMPRPPGMPGMMPPGMMPPGMMGGMPRPGMPPAPGMPGMPGMLPPGMMPPGMMPPRPGMGMVPPPPPGMMPPRPGM
jgi:small nuclear ribonucleoprotein B and B'